MSLASRTSERLKTRAHLLQTVRTFFKKRSVLEVDCPILSQFASVDEHIDLIAATLDDGSKRYLHSSPEYGMKRLLAEGSGDIYQLSHVFRAGEVSLRHNPEFTMIEWYRIAFSLHQMVQETIALIETFLGERPISFLSYREAFEKTVGVNPHQASASELRSLLKIETHAEKKDDILNVLLDTVIEPSFDPTIYTILTHYPASQAALSQITEVEGDLVSERFEIYTDGYELANGYHELRDPAEQKQRFESANKARRQNGKEELPIDTYFLKALEMGLPDCCGVAVGFDRLMMLTVGAEDIKQVLSLF